MGGGGWTSRRRGAPEESDLYFRTTRASHDPPGLQCAEWEVAFR